MSTTERRQKVVKSHPRLSLVQQCKILNIHRSGLYYRPKSAQSGESGHPFRDKTDSDSVSKRTAIPEQNGHFSHLSAINF